MSTLRVCLLLITASATAWGGWRHDCRVATHDFRKECRQNKGVPTTTTTLPPLIHPSDGDFHSENCSGFPQHCITIGDDPQLYCPPLEVMAHCSFPVFCGPPPSSPSGAF